MWGIQARLGQLLPQPCVGAGLSALALLSLSASWLSWLRQPDPPSVMALLMALSLTVAIAAAYQYPIHLRHQTKLLMVSLVYYLLAVLVTPPLAATAAGLGALAGELARRRHSGAYASDIATEVGRRVLMVWLGALVAHHWGGVAVPSPALLGVAVVLATIDTVSFPLVLAPICGERPLRVMVASARDAAVPEGMQYVVGLLGALAAAQHPWALGLLVMPAALVYVAFKALKEMHDSTRQLLENMADAVDLRDAYTGGHSRRVTEYSAAILRELGLQGPEVTLILTAARVHDIGKIGTPDAILHKPGPLTPEERAVMEMHPVHGANLLKRHGDFRRGVAIVRHHHESWDGTGYPDRLTGAEIPFGARVIAVADSFDAMTSDRPYRRGMPIHKAAQILREGRGRQWDGTVVDALLRSMADQLERPATPVLHLVQDRVPDMEQAAPTGAAC